MVILGKPFKRFFSFIMSLLLFVQPIYADEENITIEEINNEEPPLDLHIEETIRIGIDNSITLKQLANQSKLSSLKEEYYDDSLEDLIDGEEELEDGKSELKKGIREISINQDSLNEAKSQIALGIYPDALPSQTISGITFHGGDHIYTIVYNTLLSISGGTESIEVIEKEADSISKEIISGIQSSLEEKQKELDNGIAGYLYSQLEYTEGLIDYTIAQNAISQALSENLDISDISKIDTEDQADLLLEMAKVSTEVIIASEDIAKNKIALLIQNNYYEALKAKEMMKVKEVALNKAETLYELALSSYEEGLLSKDDLLASELYNISAKLEYNMAKQTYDNSLIKLKESINIPLDREIILYDVASNDEIVMDLEEGIKLGLENRLEIIKTQKQLEIYEMSMEMIEDAYGDKSDRYEEIKRLKENCKLELEKNNIMVESEIRQSYNTMITMDKMLEEAKNMVEKAESCLNIAQQKYDVGLGISSSILEQSNLESFAGTIIEVINAKENLAKAQENYLEILYGYNMAKAKYLNDIGYLTY